MCAKRGLVVAVGAGGVGAQDRAEADPGDTERGHYALRTPLGTLVGTYTVTGKVVRFDIEKDVLGLDKNGKPLGIVGGFKGALSQASVYPATLMAEAVRIPGAARIWFSHNHPSGASDLSRADEFLTQTLKQALSLVDVRVVDHMIVAGGTVLSFSERGLI